MHIGTHRGKDAGKDTGRHIGRQTPRQLRVGGQRHRLCKKTGRHAGGTQKVSQSVSHTRRQAGTQTGRVHVGSLSDRQIRRQAESRRYRWADKQAGIVQVSSHSVTRKYGNNKD